jgi:hypothetical protein
MPDGRDSRPFTSDPGPEDCLFASLNGNDYVRAPKPDALLFLGGVEPLRVHSEPREIVRAAAKDVVRVEDAYGATAEPGERARQPYVIHHDCVETPTPIEVLDESGKSLAAPVIDSVAVYAWFRNPGAIG